MGDPQSIGSPDQHQDVKQGTDDHGGPSEDLTAEPRIADDFATSEQEVAPNEGEPGEATGLMAGTGIEGSLPHDAAPDTESKDRATSDRSTEPEMMTPSPVEGSDDLPESRLAEDRRPETELSLHTGAEPRAAEESFVEQIPLPDPLGLLEHWTEGKVHDPLRHSIKEFATEVRRDLKLRAPIVLKRKE